MKISHFIIAGLVILGCFAAITVGVLLAKQSEGITNARPTASYPSPTKALPSPADEKAALAVWFAYWDESASEARLTAAMDQVSGIHPLFYRIAEDGSLAPSKVENRTHLLSLMKAADPPLVPQIGDDADYDRIRMLLYDKDVQNVFIQQMVQEAEEQGYRGWDVNIESIEPEDRNAHSAFVEQAAKELHAIGLELTVTVFAKTEKFPRTAAAAHDYARIGKAADYVQLMAYGEHNEDTEPGGQASLDWLDDVLTFAAVIPKEKLVIGLSSHGYQWGSENTALTYPEITALIDGSDVAINYDEEQSSKVAYLNNESDDEIWYEDAETIMEKIEYIQERYGIHSFILWRVGAEDQLLWEKLAQ